MRCGQKGSSPDGAKPSWSELSTDTLVFAKEEVPEEAVVKLFIRVLFEFAGGTTGPTDLLLHCQRK